MPERTLSEHRNESWKATLDAATKIYGSLLDHLGQDDLQVVSGFGAECFGQGYERGYERLEDKNARLEADNANLREQALVSRQLEHEIRLLTAIAKEARSVADKIGINYRPNTSEGRMIAALANAHDEGIL